MFIRRERRRCRFGPRSASLTSPEAEPECIILLEPTARRDFDRYPHRYFVFYALFVASPFRDPPMVLATKITKVTKVGGPCFSWIAFVSESVPQAVEAVGGLETVAGTRLTRRLREVRPRPDVDTRGSMLVT